jgi:branched-chain amino acid transport system ATP-binding protein
MSEPGGGAELVLSDVSVAYERIFVAAHGISLTVPAGRIVAMLGANGAGKTTTLRAIAGFMRSEKASVVAGEIRYGGERISGRSPHAIARRGISLVPERDKIFTSLTVDENLEVGSATIRSGIHRRASRAEVFEYFPLLRSRRSTKAGFLSGGERQMLGIGRALMAEPTLLMIDELSFGLAPIIVHQLTLVLRQINQDRGTSILFVEQTAPEAMSIADYVYILDSGRVALEGPPDQLRKREEVQEVYLGLSRREYATFGEGRIPAKSSRWVG